MNCAKNEKKSDKNKINFKNELSKGFGLTSQYTKGKFRIDARRMRNGDSSDVAIIQKKSTDQSRKERATRVIGRVLYHSYCEKQILGFYMMWNNILYNNVSKFDKVFQKKTKSYWQLLTKAQPAKRSVKIEEREDKRKIKNLGSRNEIRNKDNKSRFVQNLMEKKFNKIMRSSICKKMKKRIKRSGKSGKQSKKNAKKKMKTLQTKGEEKKTKRTRLKSKNASKRQVALSRFKSIDYKKSKPNMFKTMAYERGSKWFNQSQRGKFREKSEKVALKRLRNTSKRTTRQNVSKKTLFAQRKFKKAKNKKKLFKVLKTKKNVKRKFETLPAKAENTILTASISKVTQLLNRFSQNLGKEVKIKGGKKQKKRRTNKAKKQKGQKTLQKNKSLSRAKSKKNVKRKQSKRKKKHIACKIKTKSGRNDATNEQLKQKISKRCLTKIVVDRTGQSNKNQVDQRKTAKEKSKENNHNLKESAEPKTAGNRNDTGRRVHAKGHAEQSENANDHLTLKIQQNNKNRLNTYTTYQNRRDTYFKYYDNSDDEDDQLQIQSAVVQHNDQNPFFFSTQKSADQVQKSRRSSILTFRKSLHLRTPHRLSEFEFDYFEHS